MITSSTQADACVLYGPPRPIPNKHFLRVAGQSAIADDILPPWVEDAYEADHTIDEMTRALRDRGVGYSVLSDKLFKSGPNAGKDRIPIRGYAVHGGGAAPVTVVTP